MNAPESPGVDALVRTLEERALHLSVDSERHAPLPASWVRVRLVPRDGVPLSIAVDDEYGDAPKAGPALLLHLVLATCECVEETGDMTEWAGEAEVDVSESRDLYQDLVAVVPLVRSAVGTKVRAISSWDFHLNSAAARRLRSL